MTKFLLKSIVLILVLALSLGTLSGCGKQNAANTEAIVQAAVKAAMERKTNIFLTAQIDMECDDPRADDLYRSGVVCEIKQVMKLPGTDTLRVVVYGLYRAELLHLTSANPHLSAIVQKIQTEDVLSEEKSYEEALVRKTEKIFSDYAIFIPKLPTDVIVGVSVRNQQ